MMNYYEKNTVNNDGIALSVEVFGNKNNPAILLISGAMASARFWTDSFGSLLAHNGYFVARYDHRDTGLSSSIDFTKNPYTIRDLEKDAIAILDFYDIKKANLVGHSLGGMLVQLFALDYPDRCLSITSISDGLLTASPTEVENKILEKTWSILLANKPTLSYDESVDGFLRSYEYLNGTVPFDKAMAEAYIQDTYERSKHMYLIDNRQVKAFEVPHNHVRIQEKIGVTKQALEKINVPCLIIHGQEDYIMLPSGAQETAKAIPGALLKIVPEMGHMLFNQKLEKVLVTLITQYIATSNK